MLQLLDRVKFELDLPPLSPGESKVLPAIQTLESERQAVAARVRNLLGQANITEKRIRIGVEYRARRNQLRRSSRHDDDDRTGWYAEFAKPNPHPFSRRGAERHIDFAEPFGNVGPVWPKLPHAFGALHLLASFGLSASELRIKCLSGEISPNSTEGAVWKLGAALGKVQPKVAIKKSKAPVLSKDAWNRLSQGKRKKLARDIGLKELLDAYSPSVDELLAACGQKVCSELWGRAGRQLVMTGVPRAKVLALPAPAKSLPPVHYDLVSTFDAATAAEQQKFVRERANEFLAAVV